MGGAVELTWKAERSNSITTPAGHRLGGEGLGSEASGDFSHAPTKQGHTDFRARSDEEVYRLQTPHILEVTPLSTASAAGSEHQSGAVFLVHLPGGKKEKGRSVGSLGSVSGGGLGGGKFG